ncbi:hypothetical protein [Neorhizobium sp. T6_25]|uniref:hypothetical protein n=1 Tax=Neorhizobium sp. T6_25 TaxID=2093833 RepID=UPI000CF9A6B6|nr:hypothetical protein [Neorhizobium sp. T6_25]
MADLLNYVLAMLQNSPLGGIVRNASLVYPVLEAVHILGIALLVGPAFAFDFSVLGFGRRLVSVTTAGRCLLPISHVGLTVTAATGIALLSAQATVIANTGAAPWKFGLLILAGINVAVFHGGTYRSVDLWKDLAVTPVAARVGAAVSLVTWTGIIFAGRLLAYT